MRKKAAASLPLDPPLRKRLERLFPREHWSAAITLLETRCGSGLPLIAAQGADGIERVRCAALKLSGGSMPKLDEAVGIANTDWRDVLVAAGFANSLTAHLRWRDGDA